MKGLQVTWLLCDRFKKGALVPERKSAASRLIRYRRRFVIAACTAAILATSRAESAPVTLSFVRTTGGAFSWNNSTGVTAGEELVGSKGNWNAGSGTTAGTHFPGLAGDVANITNSTSANTTLNLDQNLTLGSLAAGFNNTAPGTITISSGGASASTYTLTFDNGSSNAILNHAKPGSGQNTLTVTAPILIAGNGVLALSNTSTSFTSITGQISSGLSSGIQTLSSTASNTTISGNVVNGSAGGTLGITLGGGTLTVSGANTYTGPTLITAGTLKAGVASVSGVSGAFGLNSAVTVSNFATAVLDLNGFASQIGSLSGGGAVGGNVSLGAGTLTTGADNTSTAYAGVISGTGGLTKVGSGTLTVSGASTYSGSTTVNAGTLKAGVSGVAGTSGAFGKNSAVSLANVAGATLDLNNFATQVGSLTGGGASGGNVLLGTANLTIAAGSGVFNGVISGSGGITVNGGTQTLASSQTYTGNTTIGSSGTLQIGNGGTAGSLGLSSSVVVNGAMAFNRTDTITQGIDFTASSITGTGSLAQVGSGKLILKAANSYSGGTTIGTGQNGASIQAQVSGALGTGTIAFDSGGNSSTARLELSSTGGITLANGITLPARTSQTAPAIQNMSGDNTLSGSITTGVGGTYYTIQSDAGTLTLSNANAIVGFTSAKTVNLQGSGNGSVTGAITGTGFLLAKSGNGKWRLTGPNSYTGGTTVIGGTLIADSANATTGSTGAGDVVVQTAGSLAGGSSGSTGIIKGAVIVNGTITAGSGTAASDSIGTLSTGNQTWKPGGSYVIKVAGTGTPGLSFDTLNMATLNLAELDSGAFKLQVVQTMDNAFVPGIYRIATTSGMSLPASIGTNDLTSLFALSIDGVPQSSNFTVTNGGDTAAGGGDTGNLYLQYAGTESAPEPTTATLIGCAGSVLLGRRVKRKASAI